MKQRNYQELVVDIILLSEDCIRTSGDADETERLPFGLLTSNILG